MRARSARAPAVLRRAGAARRRRRRRSDRSRGRIGATRSDARRRRAVGERAASSARCAASGGPAARGRLVAGPPRRPAASRRAPPRAGRVRSAAVGQVGRTRDPGAARVGRAGGRHVDQDRPAGRDARRGAARSARCSCSIRSRSRGCGRTRGHRCTARTPGTARSRSPGGSPAAGELDQRSVEGGDFWAVAAEQRLAPLLYAAAVTGAGIDTRRALDLRPGDARARPGAGSIAGERGRGRARGATRPTTPCGRSRPRPTGRAPRSRRPPRRCCAPTGSRASPARRQSCEITADRLLDERRDAVPDRRRQGVEAAAADLPGAARRGRRPRLRARDARRRPARAAAAAVPRRGRERRPAAEPGRDRLDRAEPQHPAGLDLPRPRPGPQSRYGQQAETVVNSHRARMLLPGVADLETLRYFAGLVGEEEARDRTPHDRRRRHDALDRAPAPAAGRAGGAPPAARPSRAAALRPARRRRSSGCGCGSRTGACEGWRGAA